MKRIILFVLTNIAVMAVLMAAMSAAASTVFNRFSVMLLIANLFFKK